MRTVPPPGPGMTQGKQTGVESLLPKANAQVCECDAMPVDGAELVNPKENSKRVGGGMGIQCIIGQTGVET